MDVLDLAIELASIGGRILAENILRLDKLRIVARSKDDITRDIDLEIEKTILDTVRRKSLECIFVGEEHGIVRLGSSPSYVIIVDPLDGSANYVSNMPFYSVSVAICRYRGEKTKLSDVLCGVVNYVSLNTLYVADLESGSFHIRGSDIVFQEYPHEKPTFVLYVEPRDLKAMLRFLEVFWREFPDLRVRVLGAASIELIETMLRKFYAFIDIRSKLRVVDIAAAYAVARSLDAKMTDHRGTDLGEYAVLDLPRFNVVASSIPEAHQHILKILSTVL